MTDVEKKVINPSDSKVSLKESNSADVLKPSEIVGNGDLALRDTRDTGRTTGLNEADVVLVSKNAAKVAPVCCCIDPYVAEKPHIYVPSAFVREGDVYKHRTHYLTMVICFNICYNTEHSSEVVVQRAMDGAVLKNIRVEDLENPNQFFLVKSEKCPYKHHDLQRFSVIGRILVHLCTIKGIISTCRKFVCLDDCVNTVNVATVRCERSLYSRRQR
jgi:hypothetical protein